MDEVSRTPLGGGDGSAPSRVERLAGLAAWAPRLADPSFTAGHWVPSETDAQGVIQLGWFELSPAAEAFRSDCARLGWVTPRDWPSWAASPRGRELLEHPAAVAGADEEELAFLLTTIVRGDRFNEGLLGDALERGVALAAARRATVLAAGGSSANPAE